MDTNSMKGRTSGRVSHTNPPTQLPDTKRWSHSNRMATLLREQYIAMLQEEKMEKKKTKLCQRIKIYASLYMPCHATMCAPKLLQLFLMADGWSKATITKKGAPHPQVILPSHAGWRREAAGRTRPALSASLIRANGQKIAFVQLAFHKSHARGTNIFVCVPFCNPIFPRKVEKDIPHPGPGRRVGIRKRTLSASFHRRKRKNMQKGVYHGKYFPNKREKDARFLFLLFVSSQRLASGKLGLNL